jgi:hypothetical protein
MLTKLHNGRWCVDISCITELTLCGQSLPTEHLLLRPDPPHSLAALIAAAAAAAAVAVLH